MDFVGLVSGGKDSVYSICKLIDEGYNLVGLIHMSANSTYADSYMYQTVGSEVSINLDRCFGVPLFVYKTGCNAVDQNLFYNPCETDEVEDLYLAIKDVQSKISFNAISSGAIFSNYQKNRVENVCNRLNLVSLTPLWNQNQKDLLSEMIKYGIDARIIKIASPYLKRECLNMNLSEIKDYMDNKIWKYEMNYCGEGGEYETLVLDCKHFKSCIESYQFDIKAHPEERNKSDGVLYLEFKNLMYKSKI